LGEVARTSRVVQPFSSAFFFQLRRAQTGFCGSCVTASPVGSEVQCWAWVAAELVWEAKDGLRTHWGGYEDESRDGRGARRAAVLTAGDASGDESIGSGKGDGCVGLRRIGVERWMGMWFGIRWSCTWVV
jgi:hypothetical protein